jgi:hypothetical protein
VGEVAYLAVPHLVTIAQDSSVQKRARLLGVVGSVVATMRAFPRGAAPVREEWRADFQSAREQARRLAADTLRDGELGTDISFELLGVLAALHGHHNLALFMAGGADDLSCPACGEYVAFERLE